MNIQYLHSKMLYNRSFSENDHAHALKFNQQRNHSTALTKNDDVTISQQGWSKYIESLQLKQVSNDDQIGLLFRQFYEEYHSAEAIEKRQREQLEKERAYNRLEDEFSLKSVKYKFPENTLQHTVKEALEGKVVNASIYAAELASAIRSTISMPDQSVETRAAYREMALKQAEYIAEHYFDKEQEAASFMSEIQKYYDNDVLREKGYVVIDNSNLQPFKRYSSPVSNHDEVSFYTLAKKHMDDDYFDRFINGQGTLEESAKFLMQIQNNKEKYSKLIITEFKINEQQIEDVIKATKGTLESFVWENGFVTGTTEDDFDEIIKWHHSMLNLFL